MEVVVVVLLLLVVVVVVVIFFRKMQRLSIVFKEIREICLKKY